MQGLLSRHTNISSYTPQDMVHRTSLPYRSSRHVETTGPRAIGHQREVGQTLRASSRISTRAATNPSDFIRRSRPPIVNENSTRWVAVSPTPQHQIHVVLAGAKGEAAHPHAHIAFISEPVRQPLGGCDSPADHVRFPGGARQIGFSDPETPQLRRVPGIEDGFRIDLAGAQREWLHRSAKRLRTPIAVSWDSEQ